MCLYVMNLRRPYLQPKKQNKTKTKLKTKMFFIFILNEDFCF